MRRTTGIGFVLSARVRMLLATISVAALLVLVGWVFWMQDVRYMLATPQPPGLVQAPIGAALPVGDWLARAGLSARGRPVHLHVFHPECPCSRFNADHVRELVKNYGDRVQFVGLVQVEAGASPEEVAEAKDAAEAFELGMPLWIDAEGEIARAAGVYSTPQAIVVDASGALLYRGNYNTSRYHADPRTEFARLALESLVGARLPFADPGIPSYGCELPVNQ